MLCLMGGKPKQNLQKPYNIIRKQSKVSFLKAINK